MPPHAQLRQDEHQQKYYTTLFASDELDDELLLLREPIGEVCAICLEVQSGLGEVVSKLRNHDLTETQNRIIHSYNLLGDCSRRKMVKKIAYYFLMMDIDYEFVLSETDDETMTQFILCDYSS